MNLTSMLERTAALYGSRKAVTCRGRSFTYAEFERRVRRLAGVLAEEGVRRGSAVALLHRNCHHVLEAYFAAARLGALFVPLNIRLNPGEIGAIMAHSGASVLLVEPRLEGLARQAVETIQGRRTRMVVTGGARAAESPASDGRPQGDPENRAAGTPPSLEERIEHGAEEAPREDVDDAHAAQLYYTSGTTGRPKGVILTHGNAASHALAAVAELGLTEKDVWLHAAPLFHLADAWATWAVTWTGGRHVMLPDFDAAAFFDLVEAEGVTITNLVPTMLARIVHHEGARPGRLESMRRIMSGGAPMAVELLKRVEALFPCEYVQTYGLTETSPYLTLSLLKENLRSLPEEERRRYRATTGRPMLGVEVKVVDREGREVPRDGVTVGEIVARGPTVTPGYFKDPGETARAFRDGWLHTGDLARVDPEGYLTIVDRIKDVITTGGETVYTTEVENVLYAHKAVREAAVFGTPDPEWGEVVSAAVVLERAGEARSENLIAFCRERLAGFKVPRRFLFLAELPKTGSGKIDKKALRRGEMRP